MKATAVGFVRNAVNDIPLILKVTDQSVHCRIRKFTINKKRRIQSAMVLKLENYHGLQLTICFYQ